MNDLLDRTRAHLDGCAQCFDFADCEALAMLDAEAQFNARRSFRLWLDNIETLFIPTAPACWHVRYAFNTGKGHFITAHYIGSPAGSIKTFEQAVSYARANLLSASEDLVESVRGFRPAVMQSGISLESDHE